MIFANSPCKSLRFLTSLPSISLRYGLHDLNPAGWIKLKALVEHRPRIGREPARGDQNFGWKPAMSPWIDMTFGSSFSSLATIHFGEKYVYVYIYICIIYIYNYIDLLFLDCCLWLYALLNFSIKQLCQHMGWRTFILFAHTDNISQPYWH